MVGNSKQDPFRIQLAIQGGAAKICVLVAALEAVQELQARGLIQVTRIAGTSAGAIVGTLFAAGIPMSTVKARLAGLRLADVTPKQSKVKSFLRFARGKPLWSGKGLQNVIRALVDEANPKVTTFSDIEKYFGVPVQVLAADIRNGEPVVYEGGKQIVNSVLDSCAVPFGFRAACSGDSSVVDGGICENLPSDLLTEHMSASGPVIGISFRKLPGKTPGNAISFSLALLDTAMSNSIRRAKKALDGRIFEIDTEIGSFEWERALTDGFKAEYDKVKLQAEKFFVKLVDEAREQQEKCRQEEAERIRRHNDAEAKAKTKDGIIASDELAAIESGNPWAKRYYDAMLAAGAMFKVQHSGSKMAFEHCSLTVVAWSLLAAGAAGASEYDEVKYSARFHTLAEPIFCHSIGLSHTDHETLLIKSEYWVTGPDGNKIETIKLMMSDGSPSRRKLLMCFDPVLPKDSGPYEFHFVDQARGFVGRLKEGKTDELAMTVERAHEMVKRIEMVLYAPKTYAGLRMAAKQLEAGGRPMNKSEIDTHKKHAPLGFDTLGWVGETVPAGKVFGVDLFVRKD